MKKLILRRRCIGCMQSDDKRNLLRLVVADGTLRLDERQVYQSRGVYLHRECVAKFHALKRLEQGLKVTGIKPSDLRCALVSLYPKQQRKSIRL